MSTVKISQLPLITQINANTANTLFAGVDIPTGETGKMTAHTLAQGLYSNEVLNVGANPVIFPNTAAQFSGSDPLFLQVNQQNFNANGSADYILTADVGTNSSNYIDLGINNSQFSNVGFTSMYPLDGYLYVQDGGNAGGNLIVGTASSNTHMNFIVGGTNQQNVVAKMTVNGLSLQNGSNLTFSDGTTQITAGASNAYSQAAFALANTNASGISLLNSEVNSLQSNVQTLQTQALVFNSEITSATGNTVVTQGVDATQNTNIQAAWNLANTSIQNTANIFLSSNLITNGALTVNGNTTFSGNVVIIGTRISTGNVINNGTTTFNGNVTANGTTTLNGNVIFVGPTTHQGDLITNGNLITVGTVTTTGNVNTTGTFTANGNTTFNGTFTNNGNTYNNGITILNGVLSVNGSIIPSTANNTIGTANNPFSSIYTSNAAVFTNSNVSITGTLTANGQSNFNGLVVFDNQQYNANVGAVEIIGSSSGLMVPPASNGVMLHVTGLDNVATKIMNDSFGPGNTYSVFVGRSGRGTANSPSASQAGDTIARFSGSSYSSPNSTFITTGVARMDVVTLENATDTNRGAMLAFSAVPVGSNVISQNVVTIAANVMSVGANTTLSVSNTIQYNASVNNGTVTQLTSKSTAVTCNGRTGQITTSNATLNKGAAVSFTVNNSYIVSNKDVIILNVGSGASVPYNVTANNITPGSFSVNLHNADGTGSGTNASDTLVINFAIIRVA